MTLGPERGRSNGFLFTRAPDRASRRTPAAERTADRVDGLLGRTAHLVEAEHGGLRTEHGLTG